MGAWVAALFSYGLALKPRLTRFLASVFCVEAISDYLNIGYDSLKKLKQ